MRKKCEEDDIGEPRTVRQPMGSRKVTPAVLIFIAAIWARQIVQRQEQERKRKESKRDETWCLEIDTSKGNEEEKAGEG